jgi:hypothetical protein
MYFFKMSWTSSAEPPTYSPVQEDRIAKKSKMVRRYHNSEEGEDQQPFCASESIT